MREYYQPTYSANISSGCGRSLYLVVVVRLIAAFACVHARRTRTNVMEIQA